MLEDENFKTYISFAQLIAAMEVFDPSTPIIKRAHSDRLYGLLEQATVGELAGLISFACKTAGLDKNCGESEVYILRFYDKDTSLAGIGISPLIDNEAIVINPSKSLVRISEDDAGELTPDREAILIKSTDAGVVVISERLNTEKIEIDTERKIDVLEDALPSRNDRRAMVERVRTAVNKAAQPL